MYCIVHQLYSGFVLGLADRWRCCAGRGGEYEFLSQLEVFDGRR